MVLLPLPEGPTSATVWPGYTVNVTSLRICFLWEQNQTHFQRSSPVGSFLIIGRRPHQKKKQENKRLQGPNRNFRLTRNRIDRIQNVSLPIKLDTKSFKSLQILFYHQNEIHKMQTYSGRYEKLTFWNSIRPLATRISGACGSSNTYRHNDQWNCLR